MNECCWDTLFRFIALLIVFCMMGAACIYIFRKEESEEDDEEGIEPEDWRDEVIEKQRRMIGQLVEKVNAKKSTVVKPLELNNNTIIFDDEEIKKANKKYKIKNDLYAVKFTVRDLQGYPLDSIERLFRANMARKNWRYSETYDWTRAYLKRHKRLI